MGDRMRWSHEPPNGPPRLHQLDIFEPFPGSILGIHPKDSVAQATAVAKKLEGQGEGHCVYTIDRQGQTTGEIESVEVFPDSPGVRQHWFLSWTLGGDGKISRVTMGDSNVMVYRK